MLTTEQVGGRPAGNAFRSLSPSLCLVLILAGPNGSSAQEAKPANPVSALKQMSLEELMDIEVTSVSKRPEKLLEAASAIQVISGDEIRRAGATSLPESLRLAGN